MRKLMFMAAFVQSALFASMASGETCFSATPIWSDEFDGDALDTSKWEALIGDGCDRGLCGWGNNELQFYRAENATVSDGSLKITAKTEAAGERRYTSARLRTANMPNGGAWSHGRFEARIKIPGADGMWPAFWMMPTDADVGWPMSGEIDIMEWSPRHPEKVLGTIHYGDPWPGNEHTGGEIIAPSGSWTEEFHEFAVEWTPNKMRWFVNGELYSTKTPRDLGKRKYWVFENYAYHIILNLAVGGALGGDVDDSALPQVMEVDYVRVYAPEHCP
jgi:beta-glucanase (GH16 family)